MRSLLDINVLIALLDPDHPAHPPARGWLASNAAAGWATCPITQNGTLRIMSQPAYPNPVPLADLLERLREAAAHASHEFWPDDVSLLDPSVVGEASTLGPKQITDVYLLALATARKGRFVTFDRGIPLSLVLDAQRRNLVVL